MSRRDRLSRWAVAPHATLLTAGHLDNTNKKQQIWKSNQIALLLIYQTCHSKWLIALWLPRTVRELYE
jgi:hypothetical protein